jgi:CubicO group peptidase (beta-lactamase class C family)
MNNLALPFLTRILAISLLLLAPGLAAKDIKTGKPGREGISAERLERIDTHMQAQVGKGVMVGGQGMIARNGKIVFNRTWGMSDREAGKPMDEDAIYRIYSMTKPVTGVALMMLYEEGKFFLNDPVAKYIPELANLQVALSTADSNAGVISNGTNITSTGDSDKSVAGQTRPPLRQPTIRDLMRHTGGFTYGIFGETEVDMLYRQADVLRQPNLKAFASALGKIPLQYEPGSRWHYSVSVDIQGYLVEVLSGMSLGEFMRTRIFEPLGMEDTSFRIAQDKLPRLAQLYSPKETEMGMNTVWQLSNSTELEVASPERSRNYIEGGRFESGGGGLLSTTDDYMRFCLMLLNGGELNGTRLLSPKSVELMSTNHLTGTATILGRPGAGFGLNFAVVENLGQSGELGSVGEYSWGGAAGTRFWIDPVENLVGIFMVQSIPHQTRLGSEFKLLAYQAIAE